MLRARLHHLAFAGLALWGLSANGADEAPIRQAISEFLDRQAKALPGPASHDIGPINAVNIADGCRQVVVSQAAGMKAWGRTHVQARCASGAGWSVFVPVVIHVTADYVVSARPLKPGQILAAEDLTVKRGDLADLPQNVLTDVTQAIGQVVGATLAADRPLRADQLKKPLVVRQGQNTRVVSLGGGFQVTAEGKAIGNAVAGQVVQVRMASGQVISGVAQADGTVRASR